MVLLLYALFFAIFIAISGSRIQGEEEQKILSYDSYEYTYHIHNSDNVTTIEGVKKDTEQLFILNNELYYFQNGIQYIVVENELKVKDIEDEFKLLLYKLNINDILDVTLKGEEEYNTAFTNGGNAIGYKVKTNDLKDYLSVETSPLNESYINVVIYENNDTINKIEVDLSNYFNNDSDFKFELNYRKINNITEINQEDYKARLVKEKTTDEEMIDQEVIDEKIE